MKTTKKNATKLAKNEEAKQGINLAPASVEQIEAAASVAASVTAPTGSGTTAQPESVTTINPSVGGAAAPKPRLSAADQIKINEWIYSRDYKVANYVSWVKSHFNEVPFDESALRAAMGAVPGMSEDAINKAVDAAKRAAAASVPTLDEVYNVMSSKPDLFLRVYGCELPERNGIRSYNLKGVPMSAVTCQSRLEDYISVEDCPLSFGSIYSIVSCIASASNVHDYWAAYNKDYKITKNQMLDNFEVGVRAGVKLGMSEEDILQRVRSIIAEIEVADIKSYTRLIVAQSNLLTDLYNLDRALVKLVGWDGAISRSAAYRKLSNKRSNLSIQINNISELLGGSTC